MDYKDFKYIFPPRPEQKIKTDSLNKFPSDKYLAQVKLNGSCAVLFVEPNGHWQLWDRHKTILPTRNIDFENLKSKIGWNVFAGEYLNKNKQGEHGDFNKKFVIWDLLVKDGEYLVGKTFEQRQEELIKMMPCLTGIVNESGEFEQHEFLCCTPFKDIYRAPVFIGGDYTELYNRAVKTDLYEGLVLKRRNAILTHGFNEKNNTDWQIKCRKETKNYSF
jgi:hypothetical protein